MMHDVCSGATQSGLVCGPGPGTGPEPGSGLGLDRTGLGSPEGVRGHLHGGQADVGQAEGGAEELTEGGERFPGSPGWREGRWRRRRRRRRTKRVNTSYLKKMCCILQTTALCARRAKDGYFSGSDELRLIYI